MKKLILFSVLTLLLFVGYNSLQTQATDPATWTIEVGLKTDALIVDRWLVRQDSRDSVTFRLAELRVYGPPSWAATGLYEAWPVNAFTFVTSGDTVDLNAVFYAGFGVADTLVPTAIDTARMYFSPFDTLAVSGGGTHSKTVTDVPGRFIYVRFESDSSSLNTTITGRITRRRY